MIRRILSLILIAACLCSLSGCAGEWRKKFVRKKKYEKKQIPVFKPKSYEAEFTTEQRYLNHYAFWKNAQTEAIKILDGKDRINNKKLKFHANYAVVEIKEMHKLLPDEKQQQIEPHIKELTDLAEKIKDSSYLSSHKHTLAKQLKHIYNEVRENFSYIKMKKYLQGTPSEVPPFSTENMQK